MSKMTKILIWILLYFTINGFSAYYVATNGSDTNTGSISDPFYTIQKAINVCSAGNADPVIYIGPGTYASNISPVIRSNKNPYMKLTAWNATNQPVLTGNAVSKNFGLVITNTSHIIVSNIIFKDSTSSGLMLYGAGTNRIVHSFFINNDYSGIRIFGDSFDNIIQNNRIYGSAQDDGILLSGPYNNIIQSNIIYKNQSAGIRITGRSRKNYIQHNSVYSNSDYGIYLDGNFTDSNNCSTNYIINNQIYGSSQNYGIYLRGSKSHIVKNNHLYDNQTGLLCEFSDLTAVISNEIYNNNVDGIYGLNSDFLQIRENAMFLNGNTAITFIGTNDFIAGNRIYKNNTGIGLSGHNAYIAHNEIYSNTLKGITPGSSVGIITNTIVSNIIQYQQYGIYNNENSFLYAEANRITHNSYSGFYFYMSDETKSILKNNIISSNAVYGIYTTTTHNLSLISNLISYNKRTALFIGISDNWLIEGNIISHSTNGIYFATSSTQIQIQNNLILSNEKYGIYSIDSRVDALKIKNNEITGRNQNYGMYITDSKNLTIRSNHIHQNYQYGIYITGTSNTLISYNQIQSNNQLSSGCNGIYLKTSSDSVIATNIITDNGSYGINLLSSHNILIYTNKLQYQKYGLYISDIQNVNIYNNDFSKSTSYGIQGGNSSTRYINVAGNLFKKIGMFGCYFYDIDDMYITNNIFISNNYGGVYFDATTADNYMAHNIFDYNGITISSYAQIFVNYSAPNLIIVSNSIINSPAAAGLKLIGSGIVIQSNTVINNAGDGVYGSGTAYNWIIENNRITDNNYGIQLYGTFRNCRIAENTLLQNSSFGIRIATTASYYNSVISNTISGHGGINIYFAKTNTIAYNDISHNSYYGILISGNGGSWHPNGNLIVHNTILTNSLVGVYLNDEGADNTIIASNIIGGNTQNYGIAVYAGDYTKIYRNLIYSSADTGIRMTSSATNTAIYNNTIAGSSTAGILWADSSSGDMINNIISGSGTAAVTNSSSGIINSSYNVFYNSSTVKGIFNAVSSNVTANPYLSTDTSYTLTSGHSSAYDSATNIPGITDIFSGDAPDRGYQESTLQKPNNGPYYVSPSGSDANNGTKEFPFLTLQKAADEMSAGVTIATTYAAPGVYAETVNINNNNNTGYMVFTAWSNSQYPILSDSASYGFNINTADKIIIEKFIVKGYTYGIYLQGDAKYNIIRKNIAYSNQIGIMPYSGTARSNTIISNEAYDNQYGIAMNNADYNTVSYNLLHHNVYYGSSTVSGAQHNIISHNQAWSNTIAGIQLYDDTVDYNTVISNETWGLNQPHGIILYQGDYNIIKGNYVHNNTENGIYIAGSAQNNEIACNIILDNDLRGLYFNNDASDNNSIYSNIITGAQQDYGIYAENADSNIFKDNKIFRNQNYGVRLTGSAAANQFIHNSIYSNNNSGIWLSSVNNNTIASNDISRQIYGVYLNGSSSTNLIKANYIHHQTGGSSPSGIYIEDTCTYDKIIANTICSNDEIGIYLNGTDIHYTIIASNDIFGTQQNDGIIISYGSRNQMFQNHIYLNHYGLYLRNTSTNTISGNIITGNSNIGLYIADNSFNNEIKHNSVFSNVTSGIFLAGESFMGTTVKNTLIASNNIREKNSGIIVKESDNTKIYYNLITSRQALKIYDGSDNFELVHNTIEYSKNSDAVDISGSANGKILNTILFCTGTNSTNYAVKSDSSGTTSVDYNLFYGNAATNGSITLGTHNQYGSPLLNSDYEITNILSRAIDNATNYFGFSYMGSAPDIGAEESGFCPPEQVQNLQAAAVSFQQINLTWNDLTNETSYLLYRSFSKDTNTVTNIASLAADTVNYADTGLTSETTYFYWIKAVNPLASSPFSSFASNRTPVADPIPPSYVSVTDISQTELHITWENITIATAYEIYRNTVNNTNSAGLIALVNQTNYADTGLATNTLYFYWIKSLNEQGISEFSLEGSNRTYPSVPESVDFDADALVYSEVKIEIFSPLSNVSVYTIYRTTITDTNTFQAIGYLPASSTVLTDKSVDPSTEYYYSVKAFNKAGASGFQFIVHVETLPELPDAPQFLTVSTTNGTNLHLVWTDSTNEEEYNIYFSTNSSITNDGSFEPDEDETNNIFTYYKNNFPNNIPFSHDTQYYIWVAAANESGRTFSKRTNIFIVPPKPVFTAGGKTQTSLELHWTNASLNPVTVYTLFRSTNTAWNTAQAVTNLAFNMTHYTDRGLTPLTYYYYRIIAYNQGGASSDLTSASVYSNKTSGYTPAQPQATNCTALNSSSLALFWNDLSDETNYAVFRSTVNDTNTIDFTNYMTADTTAYTDTGLSPNTLYFYWIRAYNAYGGSPYSEAVSNTTFNIPPSVPVLTSASNITYTNVKIIWAANPNTTSYTLYRALVNDSNSCLPVYSGSETNFIDTVSGDTIYFYWLKACNEAGSSGYSTVLSNTTLPNPPSGASHFVSLSALSTNSLYMAWTAIPNASSYTLFRSLSNNTNSPLTKFYTVSTNYTDSSLEVNTYYYYWVKGYNVSGSSPYSSAIAHTGLPTQPQFINSLVLSSNSLALKWHKIDNVTQYTLFRSLNKTNFAFTASLTSTNFIDLNLTPDTVYYYKLKARNHSGSSVFSEIISNRTLPSKPNQPVFADSRVLSTNSVRLEWYDLSNETSYTLFRSLTTNFTSADKIAVLQNQTVYTDTGLQADTNYYYQLQAYNQSGASVFSEVLNIRTVVFDTNAPDAVSALHIAAEETGIILQWTNPTNSDFAGIRIIRKSESAPVNENDGTVFILSNRSSFTDTSVQEGITYYYAVYTYDTSTNFSSQQTVSGIIEPDTKIDTFQFVKNPVRLSEGEMLQIRYTKDTQNVQFEIYTIVGSLVCTVKGENGLAVWDGKNSGNKTVASGIYLVLMKIDQKVTAVKKAGIIR